MPDVDHIAEITPMRELGEFDDSDPADVPGGLAEQIAADQPEVTETPEGETPEGETVPETTPETPETPTYSTEEVEALKADAEAMKEFKAHLQTLPPDKRQAALVALGLAEAPKPETNPSEYAEDPTAYLETNLLPVMESVKALPEFTSQVQDAFDRHATLLDETAIHTAYLQSVIEVLAEQAGIEIPTLDAKNIREQAYQGKNYRDLVKEAVKPAKDKMAAVKAQAARERPRTPGNASGNGVEPKSGKLIDYFRMAPVE